jgi:hypothetical protein
MDLFTCSILHMDHEAIVQYEVNSRKAGNPHRRLGEYGGLFVMKAI